jgi:hypothetical protein
MKLARIRVYRVNRGQLSAVQISSCYVSLLWKETNLFRDTICHPNAATNQSSSLQKVHPVVLAYACTSINPFTHVM